MARDDELSTEVSGRVSTFVGEDDTGPLSGNVRLLCVAGADLGRAFRLQADSVTLGRATAVDIPLKTNNVSRHHARVVISPHGARIEDLGSRNGTIVGGERIERPRDLNDGDEIVVGGAKLLFQISRATRSTATAPAGSSPAR